MEKKVPFNHAYVRTLLANFYSKSVTTSAEKFDAHLKAERLSNVQTEVQCYLYLLSLNETARLNTIKMIADNGISKKKKQK